MVFLRMRYMASSNWMLRLMPIPVLWNVYWRSAMARIFLNIPKPLTKWNKWKPKWLYEAMPFIYSVTGLTMILHFGTPAGYGAGALLLVAALWIWILRSAKNAFMNRIE